ncbi:hypothetical protein E5720_21395 [Rhodococcus sp. PAMC28707]|uniref:hypothetical protein n=1 Tax=unclassified Rhodococcus (in: high G+C Gram-positive bacteria) TaxID=192944 RepID=UPI00109DC090|nr:MULTISPECIES: hypothetical protein [unclassified Rhodococcus (in: high G+C Gram-positive bacteria)]QCB51191.1 hypothetical protein E5769_14130 [Rhodococcus sp. PAMC28705]QCB60641.1 hypothetical protein E5720_21395 [Rhodococcus sp. PAMC28707]
MTLSPLDDYPVHQIAEPIRHVGTSDRNFYDRYYFNCHAGVDRADPLFLIIGLGQYPNLGVCDGFAVLRRGDDHLVFRASRALGEDRMDLSVGPLRIEIIEGLHRLRVVLEPSLEAPDLSFDLEFESDVPANLEARHFHRQLERVTFDTQRFVQTGTWAGTLTLDGEAIPVTPDTWRGNRDRSWGVRPVGEAEPPGRKADPVIAAEQNFFWIYSIMQFEDFTIVTVIQEDRYGRRIVEDSTRVFADRTREREWLGRPDHELTFVPGTREVETGTLYFRRPGSPGKSDHVLTVTCEPVLPHYLGVGTGYGLEQDWRHGMWQGELVVQGFREKVSEIEPWKKMFSPVDNLARFTIIEDGVSLTGAGLFEVAVIGPHEQYGFTGVGDVAP